MIPHPAQLDAAYGVNAWEPLCEATFTDPDGNPLGSVRVTEGELVTDGDVWPRQEATFRVPVELTPALTKHPVSPYGGTVVLRAGARVLGTDYLFTLATLDVFRTRVVRPDGYVEVRAVSHEARVNEDRYDTRDWTPAGKVSDVVSGIVRRTLGSNHPVRVQLTRDPQVEADTYPLDGDVWPTVEQLMRVAGGEAVFTEDGTLLLRDLPTKATAPVLTFRTGETGPGTLTGYESERAWAPNRVVLVWRTEQSSTKGLRYKWEATRTATPGTGKVSVNTSDPKAASVLYVHRTAASGQDVAESFAGLTTGDRVGVVEQLDDGPDKRLRYRVTGRATIGASVISIPVDLTTATGSEPADESDVDVNVSIQARERVGRWADQRATSPSRVSGPYGRHTARETYTVDRGTLPTQSSADRAAEAKSRQLSDLFRTVQLRTIPAMWVEPGDTVGVELLGTTTSELLLVQRVVHDLSGLDVSRWDARDYSATAT